MKVNAKFKRELLAGKTFPALTDPDVEQGQVIVIEPGRVWITVLRRTKADTWEYLLCDDRPNLLPRGIGGPTHVPSRAIGSSDNTQPGNLWTEPECLDADTQREQTRRAHLKEASRRDTEDEAARAAQQFNGLMRQMVVQVARAGGNPLIAVARMRRHLEAELANQLADDERKVA